MSQRLQQLQRWLAQGAGLSGFELTPASEDASFRRYFRVHRDAGTLIAVDAPPAREDSRPFLRVAGALGEWGLNAPRVLAHDLEQGFMLLSDLGQTLYLDVLAENTVERLYGDAIAAIGLMQARGLDRTVGLPDYDEALLRAELGLFRDWYLGRHLGLELDAAEGVALERLFALLVASALEQPQVFVHRDYHSRNLLVTERNNPGILDFQDAVYGPLTYDPVSLLRDCYVAWPRERVEGWALGFLDLARKAGVPLACDEARFMRWFDLMGVQRHLKATGIFARLNHRDGKPGYLSDIPRTLGYVREMCGRYAELAEFGDLLDARQAWPRA